MKILLVHPPKAPTVIGGEDIHVFEPLDLEYVAAGVAGHHDLKILDMRIEKKLNENLREFKPDLVGLTGITPHVNTVKKLCKEIKEWNPGVLTVVGGHHASLYPRDFLTADIDVIVSGDGVSAFKTLTGKLGKGKKHLEEFLSQQDNKTRKIIKTPVENPDDFPFPKRELTRKYRKHYHSEWMKPLASMLTSKGCPFKCNFCALWKLTGGNYVKRKPESIVRELKEIEEEYIFFADAESFVDEERMKKLADLIKKEGIKKKYFLYCRSDTITKYPRLIQQWRNIGLARAFVGLEFFRDEDLAAVQKESTIKDNEQAIKVLRDFDIEIVASFLVRPEFTQGDFKSFVEYCRDRKINPCVFSILTPLPGTDSFEQVKSKLITDNYDLFDLSHPVLPTKLPLKKFYKEYANLFKRVLTLEHIISFYGKYKLKEIPSAMYKYMKAFNKLKKAYKDFNV